MADAEHVNGQGKHRQVSPPRVGLDWTDPKLTVDATDLLTDADLATTQIAISPAQTEDLAAPQPMQEQEHEGRIERVIMGRRFAMASPA